MTHKSYDKQKHKNIDNGTLIIFSPTIMKPVRRFRIRAPHPTDFFLTEGIF